ncbi:hypothetical protein ACS0TY_010145 [Phlomoides rotata]
MPVPEVDEWVVPDYIKKFICEAPSCLRQAGRPKLSRRHSSLESTTSPRKTQKCSHCNKPSHNRVNCREKCPIVQKSEEEGDEEDEEEQEEQEQEKEDCNIPKKSNVSGDLPKTRKCSVCGVGGHNKRKCPRSSMV